ncbi:MAG: tetratricopeptide repeat protein [Spirochaetia bacterium]|nr:tetratricopeptide repeat protein [Spirochaetia bacterium]
MDTDSPRYLAELAQEHYEYKEYDQALFLYLKLVERFSSQKERFEKELAWAHYEIGFIYLLQGRTTKAKESFNRVLNDFSTLAPRTLAEERLAELNKKKNEKKS